jgi:anaerobic selenocysteine-containing dehydrogenase
MTDTARYADILLPATSQMEHLDLHFAYGHLYAQLNLPAIPRMGEARPNIEVQHALASRMGYTDACFEETAEDIIRSALDVDDPRVEGVSFEYLRDHGYAKLKTATNPYVPYENGGFDTPTGKVELYSERARADGFDPLPHYEPLAESPDGDPELARQFPINLLTPAAHHFLNSSFANLASLQRAEKAPRVWINPRDAAERGIVNGSWVRVWNGRGEARLQAMVSHNVKAGVAWSPSLWWGRESPGGVNVNALTSDRLADMGGGPTFHTNLVQIESGAE